LLLFIFPEGGGEKERERERERIDKTLLFFIKIIFDPGSKPPLNFICITFKCNL